LQKKRKTNNHEIFKVNSTAKLEAHADAIAISESFSVEAKVNAPQRGLVPSVASRSP